MEWEISIIDIKLKHIKAYKQYALIYFQQLISSFVSLLEDRKKK